MRDLSTVAGSNSPPGSEAVGTSLDDYLRTIQSIIRNLRAVGVDVPAAATIDLNAFDAEFVRVTGTATVTSLGTCPAGFRRVLRFAGACTLTHSANLVLPRASNVSTVADGVYAFRSLGSGAWILEASTAIPTPITASLILDSTAAGRTLLTAADAAAQRTALDTGGLNTINTWNAVQVFGGAAGSEGGEIGLQAPVTGTSLTGNVAVDVAGNAFRVFGTFNGQTRGFSMNFAGGRDGQHLDVLHTGNYATTNAAALGTAAPGSETTVARADHVHPMPTAAQVGAAPASHTHTASHISDSTATGRSLITAVDAAAGRTALGLGTAATQPSTAFAPSSHVGSGGSQHTDATTSVSGFMSAADKTKLDGVAAGATATPLSSTTPAALGTAAVGTGTTAARADHVHPLPANATTSVAGLMSSADKTKLDGIAASATNTPLSSTAPAALGTADVGVGTTAARADHVHPMPTAAQVGAAPASHTHTASQISDSTAAGRSLLTAADAAAQRTALDTGGLNTINTWNAIQVFGGAAGLEGGEFGLQAPVTGTNLTGNVAVDIHGNSFRVFGTFNGQTRGFNMNFAGGRDGQHLDVLHTGNSAQVVAGTVTNRAMVWNNTTGRVEQGSDIEDSRGNVRDVPVNTQNGAYTFAASDRGRKVMKDGATAITYTLPTGLASGTTIIVRNKNAAGNITIARSGTTTLRIVGSGTNANATLAPWGEALLHHEGGEEWVISGTGVS